MDFLSACLGPLDDPMGANEVNYTSIIDSKSVLGTVFTSCSAIQRDLSDEQNFQRHSMSEKQNRQPQRRNVTRPVVAAAILLDQDDC